jgi:CheY-like chemotaxis protein
MGFKVLVVDDEKDLRDLLVLLLKSAGYETESASNGTEAFQKIQNSHPNFVISDIRMPQGNGFDLMRNVQTLAPPQVPILFITGYSDGNLAELKEAPNFAGLMTKPVTGQNLIRTVRSIQQKCI